MKIALLVISNNEIIATKKNDSLATISSTLHKNGFELETIRYVKVDYNKIIEQIEEQQKICQAILVIVENQLEASFLTKKAVAKITNDELITNTFAMTNIEKYFKNSNIPFSKEGNTEAFFSSRARCISNPYGIMQGGLIEGECAIITLPLEAMQLKKMFVSSVLPYLLEKAEKLEKMYVFKTFGLTQQEMFSVIKDLIKNKYKINIICNEKLLDGEVIIENNPKIKQENTDSIVQSVYSRLADYIYAESDYSLTERAKDLLNLTKGTFCVAEEITAGKVSSDFFADNADAKEYLPESYITITNQSKTKILGVDEETIKKTSPYSSEVAYEMALGALENSGATFAVSTVGCVEKGNEDYGKACICVGTTQGIHVYKHQFSGDRVEIINKVTNATFFHLIKKVKHNDFNTKITI